MGTRSLTFVIEARSDEPIICMYRQFDGYPSGHGDDLAKFLTGMKIVNGLGPEGTKRVANGAGCLAAQIVARFKDGPGGSYLHAPRLNMDCGQDYEYWIDVPFDGGAMTVTVKNPNEQIFKGSVAAFAKWCKITED